MQYLGLAVEEFTSNDKEGNFSTITNACTGGSEYKTNLNNELVPIIKKQTHPI